MLALILRLINDLRAGLKKRKCTHPRFWETRACDAVCCECNKNLGFIKDIRGTGREEIFKPIGYYR